MYVNSNEDVKEVEEVLKTYFIRGSGGFKVMVASEELYVTQGTLGKFLEYLRGCIVDRFIPWVYIKIG